MVKRPRELPEIVEELASLAAALARETNPRERLVIVDQTAALADELRSWTAAARGDLALELRDAGVSLNELTRLLAAKGDPLSVRRLQTILTDARRRAGRPPAPPGRPFAGETRRRSEE